MNDRLPKAADSIYPDTQVIHPVSSLNAQSAGGMYNDSSNSLLSDELDVHEQPDYTQQGYIDSNVARPKKRFKPFSHRKTTTVSLIITILVLVVTASTILIFARYGNNKQESRNAAIEQQDINLKNAQIPSIPKELKGSEESLLVSGDIITRGVLKISNGNFVTVLRAENPTADQTLTIPIGTGTFCIDTNNCNFASQTGLDQTNAGIAQASTTITILQNRLGQLVVPVVRPSSLVNNQAGAVAIQGTSNQISVNTSGGTITLAGPQDLATVSSPTFSSLLLNANFTVNGTVTVGINCSGFTNGGVITTNANGQLVCDNDDGGAGGGTVSSPGGTSGTVALFTGAQTIADSIISQALGTVTIAGDGVVTGNVSAATLSGNGSALTALNASNISSGTLSDLRVSANVSLLGQTISNGELVNSSLTVSPGIGLSGGGSVALGGSTTLN